MECSHGSHEHELISEIDRLLATGKNNIIIAIDGRCASGKTTLSKALEKDLDCNVFHMDDFFLRPSQRTKERLSIPGENIDHERFLKEVLLPLVADREVAFQRYDCHGMILLEPEVVPKKRLSIVEGVYCMHPMLIDFYDLKVFMDIEKEAQRERIEKRNAPQMAERFFSTWIPLEEAYFDALKIREKADLILK